MIIHLVIIEDRHADVDPHLFTTQAAAVAFARKTAEAKGLPDVTAEEWNGGVFPFYATHPTVDDSVWVTDCDSVWVTDRELDAPEDGDQ
jgi:hypothetical protein